MEKFVQCGRSEQLLLQKKQKFLQFRIIWVHKKEFQALDLQLLIYRISKLS